jgi:multiple sugar transport system substrate-binding protein
MRRRPDGLLSTTLLMIVALVLLAPGMQPAGAATPDFRGVTLRVGLPTGYDEAVAFREAATEAANRLGAKLEVLNFTVDQLHDKLLLDYQAKNPAWDIVFVTTTSASEWMRLGLVTPISTFMKENPAVVDEKVLAKDDLYRTEDFTFDGQWVGFPTYATGVALFWRTDLFNDPTEKANFQKKYGYALKPPETYGEFRDMAEFFTRKKGEPLMSKPLEADFYGTVHSNKPPSFLWYDFVNYLVAFGANDIYDPVTKRPTMNSKAAIEAVKYYVELAKFQPPGHLNMSSGEAASLFAAGHVAMQIEYFQRMTAIVLNPTKSKVSDRTDFSVLPSQKGVSGRPHAAHAGGNAVAIYSLSTNKAAAYKVIELSATRELQKKILLDKFPNGGYVPPRLSLMKDPEMRKQYPWMTKALNELLLRKDIYYFQLGQIPEYFASIDILGAQIHRAL